MTKQNAMMLRPQTSELGTFVPGILYQVTEKTSAKFKAYEQKGFAVLGTKKEIEAALKSLAKNDQDRLKSDLSMQRKAEKEQAKAREQEFDRRDKEATTNVQKG